VDTAGSLPKTRSRSIRGSLVALMMRWGYGSRRSSRQQADSYSLFLSPSATICVDKEMNP